MNGTKQQFLIVTFILHISFFLTVTVSAQQKVVVIPLFKSVEVKEPLEPYSPLPDTLQNISYTATFGEDNDYTINPPSYSYYGDGTVTDNVTGLVWEQTDDNVAKNWNDAWDYCQNLVLPPDGWTDWRLPAVNELMSIVHYGTDQPAIVLTAFPRTNSAGYWTANTYAGSSGMAWYVNFNKGDASYASKSPTILAYVRCVR